MFSLCDSGLKHDALGPTWAKHSALLRFRISMARNWFYGKQVWMISIMEDIGMLTKIGKIFGTLIKEGTLQRMRFCSFKA
jgi:hypothetical protein